jgi:Ca2+-transporting ATPase
MVWLALGLSVVVPTLGVLVAGQPLKDMILTGLALAFATIPEELPIIITMVLGLGAYRLSKQRAIVRRLKAVESLGAVTVIATDKTGTLTENRMEVDGFFPADNQRRMREIGILCTASAGDSAGPSTDPLDAALLSEAQRNGVDAGGLHAAHPLVREYSFDNDRKCMSMIRQDGDGTLVAVKGAPEAVLERATRRESEAGDVPLSPLDRGPLLEEAARMGSLGLRVIALAQKKIASRDPIAAPLSQQQAESDLTFAGLIGFADPPRAEVRDAIEACGGAGIRTVMITGDHPSTARAIASQVGLDGNCRVVSGAELDRMSDEELARLSEEVSIYARTTPEHKLRIVHALHAKGERVALTGDGINDAPALVAADVGVAMGESGSDIAREAADIVLADDNFTTITNAVSEGRRLYENLTKAVRYYLACKVALVLTTLVPVLLRLPLPFAPIQIILMELFMDLAASATFVAEPQEGDLMKRAPRDLRLSFMNRAMVSGIFTSAFGLGAAVTAAYLAASYGGSDLDQARTVAFATWILGHVLLALNMRSERQPLSQLGFLSNRFMAIWAGAAVLFMLIVVLVPQLHGLVKTAALTWSQWSFIVGASVIGTFWMEIRKLVTFRRRQRDAFSAV